MNKLNSIQKVFLIGIGGIGMSALARYFLHRGCIVHGYDRTRTALCETLEPEGMGIIYEDDEKELPGLFTVNDAKTLIIYTPAIPSHSNLLRYFTSGGFDVQKRSQVLGQISENSFCIAVAGTHGKTTTSAMIAHILTDTGYGCSAFLGGLATNYGSNFLHSESDTIVVEADEYDRSFLTLTPSIAIITSMDADHLDIYGDGAQLEEAFREFAQRVGPEGKLLIQGNLKIENGLSYSLSQRAMYSAANVHPDNGNFIFDFVGPEVTIKEISLQLPGNHNVENAVAAIATALLLGIDQQKIKSAVESFKGVKRRFETILKTGRHIIIDDYAHHPQELKACIEAVRMLYPDKKLTTVFQPHLFSRTRDFANEFGEVLSSVDHLLLMDIYPAREEPIDGVNSAFLLGRINGTAAELCAREELIHRIAELKPELLLFTGAGDIDKMVGPAKNALS